MLQCVLATTSWFVILRSRDCCCNGWCVFLVLFFFIFLSVFFFFFNDPATTEIYTLSLHDALPIWFCCISKLCHVFFHTQLCIMKIQKNRGKRPRHWTVVRGRNPKFTISSKGPLILSPPSFQIGRAHVWTPVTDVSRMPSSAWKKKKKEEKKNRKIIQTK